MKKLIAMLLLLAALLSAAACPALAEEEKEAWGIPVTNDELLGVWQGVDNQALTVLFLPGSYAPAPKNAKLPEMFVEGRWHENESTDIVYLMHANKRGSEEDSFLSSLLGKSVANAVKVIDFLNNGDKNSDDILSFDYSHASIGIEWIDYGEWLSFTDDASGSFVAFHDDDMSVKLFWMDNYDPHISALELGRVLIEAPSAEALTEGVLRPVIDMADDAQVQTALALMRWAAVNYCMRMDATALANNLRTAFAALEPADAQAFKDNYAKISVLMLDAMGLNPNTLFSVDRNKPFEDAGLADAVSQIATTENKRAVDMLNDAIGAMES